MPRLRAIGLAPAATFFRPSWTIAWPRTVAVVVPSPAMSLVLEAISLASWAPMFSNGSSSSMSLAMVTPSLVIVGEPNFFSRTTLRPLGPRVILTASARASMPFLRAWRAASSKSSLLGHSGALLVCGLSFRGRRRVCLAETMSELALSGASANGIVTHVKGKCNTRRRSKTRYLATIDLLFRLC